MGELITKIDSKYSFFYLNKYLNWHTLREANLFFKDSLMYLSIIRTKKSWAIILIATWAKKLIKLLIRSILLIFYKK